MKEEAKKELEDKIEKIITRNFRVYYGKISGEWFGRMAAKELVNTICEDQITDEILKNKIPNVPKNERSRKI